jgi:hypothetical protein
MHTNVPHKWLRNSRLIGGLILASGIGMHAQTAAPANSKGASATSANSALESLAESVRQLQATVQGLQGQVQTLQKERDQTRAELAAIRKDATTRNSSGDNENAVGENALSTLAYPTAATVSMAEGSAPTIAEAQSFNTEERVARLEETEELAEARIAEHNQTKVESGSKYRVRLSGIVLLNLFSNRGGTDSIDVPQIAMATNNVLGSSGTFGGSLRQSQIGLEAFGPQIGGARTSANVRFDFAGGFPYHSNGATEGLVRLRTGTIRMDWKNTSLVAGQDSLFFAPSSPTSIASIAVPPLSYAGNLWAWTPQVRLEHRVTLAENSTLTLAGGILDPLSGEIPIDWDGRQPSWGEQSGHPAFASRVALTQRMFGREVTIGVGNFLGQENWGLNRKLKNVAGTLDLTVPLGKYFGFTGFFYRGQSVAGLGGGIGQSVLWTGNIMDPSTVFHGLNSEGGWAQLKFTPKPKFEVNSGFGQDNPFAHELRKYGPNGSYVGPLLSRNQSPFANFIYKVRSDVMFSMEYRYLKTTYLDAGSQRLNHVNAALAYTF